MISTKTRLGGLSDRLKHKIPHRNYLMAGQVAQQVGLMVESTGPAACQGDQVLIKNSEGTCYKAEVVGFRDDRLQLMPVDKLEKLRPGDLVLPSQSGFRIPVGPELLGRVIDGMGRPLDGKGPIISNMSYPIKAPPPSPMNRPRVTEHFTTGVKTIDSFLSCGKGQRIGIFAGSGVGKSTLLGMISRNCSASINVIALIGERGKEVLDFIEESLGEEGLARSVVIVVTSDQSALHRVRGADTAMAVAEYFRDQGEDVLFVMDSVTRYAMAQREIGLSAGEPPTTKGYPPSVFGLLPELLERPGNSHAGSITAFITVLVEGDDMNDPIADTVRGILDGHILLSRNIAARGLYPSVDILHSVSRVMKDVTNPDHQAIALKLREIMATYHQAEDMINIGAYASGSNPEIDMAIKKNPEIEAFLKQGLHDNVAFDDCMNQLISLIS